MTIARSMITPSPRFQFLRSLVSYRATSSTRTMSPNWTHLVRFIAEEDGQIHLGQVDAKRWPDIGLATVNGQSVEVKLVKGSVFDGVVGEKVLHIAQV